MPPKKDKKPRRPRARATGGGKARAVVKHEHVHHYEPLMHARQPALFMNTPSVEEQNPLLREIELIRKQMTERHVERPRTALMTAVGLPAPAHAVMSVIAEPARAAQSETPMEAASGYDSEKEEKLTRFTGENPLAIHHRQAGGRAADELTAAERKRIYQSSPEAKEKRRIRDARRKGIVGLEHLKEGGV